MNTEQKENKLEINKRIELEKHEAEVNKILAEAEKVKTEKRKLDIEISHLENDNNKAWYRKESFVKFYIALFLGIGVIGFYLHNIIIPSYNRDIINRELEIVKQNKQNYIQAEELARKDTIVNQYLDSIKLAKDERERLNKEKESLNDSMKSRLNQLSQLITKLRKDSTLSKIEAKVLMNNMTSDIIRLTHLLEEEKKRAKVVAKKGKSINETNAGLDATIDRKKTGDEIADIALEIYLKRLHQAPEFGSYNNSMAAERGMIKREMRWQDEYNSLQRLLYEKLKAKFGE